MLSAIVTIDGDSYAQLLVERLTALGLSDTHIMPIDSLTVQKRLVEAGFGLGGMPESSVEMNGGWARIRVLPVRVMRLSVPMVLVHRLRAHLGGAGVHRARRQQAAGPPAVRATRGGILAQ